MLLRREMLVFAVTAVLAPAVTAYATERASPPDAATAVVPPQAPREPAAPLAPDATVRPTAGSAGLRLVLDAPLPERGREPSIITPAPSALHAEDRYYDRAPEAASASARPVGVITGYPAVAGGSTLRLTPAATGPRPGWEMSGRVGPLRWLSPLDGEGETKMRLGGRLKDQPRMPGMGLFNVGIHYNFE